MSSLLTGLVSYYQLEGNANDSLGINNCTSSNVTYSLANGIVQQGAGFGVGVQIQKINPTFTSILGANPRTVSYWLKTTSNDVMVFIGYGTDAGTPNEDYVGLMIGGKAGIGCGGGGLLSLSTTTVNDGNWHNIVGTYNGTTLSIYCDGVFESSANGTLNTITANLDFFRYQLNGSIDEVGFWNRVLTPAEITQLYNSGVGLTYPFGSETNAGILFNLL